MFVPQNMRVRNLLHDMLYAFAIFFANILKDKIIEMHTTTIYIVLLFVLFFQIQLEAWCAQQVERYPRSVWLDIVNTFAKTCSRTVAFLILSISIDMFKNHWEHRGLSWYESILYPFILLLLGITLAKIYK